MNVPFLGEKSPDDFPIFPSGKTVFELLSQTNEALRGVLEQRDGGYKNLRYNLLRKLEFFVQKQYVSFPEAYGQALKNNSEILDYIGEVSQRVRALGDTSIDEYPLW